MRCSRAGDCPSAGTVPIFVRRKWDCPLRVNILIASRAASPSKEKSIVLEPCGGGQWPSAKGCIPVPTPHAVRGKYQPEAPARAASSPAKAGSSSRIVARPRLRFGLLLAQIRKCTLRQGVVQRQELPLGERSGTERVQAGRAAPRRLPPQGGPCSPTPSAPSCRRGSSRPISSSRPRSPRPSCRRRSGRGSSSNCSARSARPWRWHSRP